MGKPVKDDSWSESVYHSGNKAKQSRQWERADTRKVGNHTIRRCANGPVFPIGVQSSIVSMTPLWALPLRSTKARKVP